MISLMPQTLPLGAMTITRLAVTLGPLLACAVAACGPSAGGTAGPGGGGVAGGADAAAGGGGGGGPSGGGGSVSGGGAGASTPDARPGGAGAGGEPSADAGDAASPGADAKADGGDGGGGAAADGAGPDGPAATSGLGPAGGACPAGAAFGDPLPQVRTATLIQGGFRELEGPVWVASQRALYFCEAGATPPTGRIRKYTPADGKLTVFLDNIGVGGLAMDPQGKLVAATYDTRRLSHIDPATAARSDVAGSSTYQGLPFNEVNDVVVRSDGNMYFSDPQYGSAAGSGQDVMAFYRLSPAGVVTRLVTAKNANGVALSPDGAWLYLATTGGPALQRFALAADGSTVGAATTWKDPASDGMAVDCAGNLYLSDAGVIKVVSPSDEPLGNISGLGTSYVTNAAFGGEDRQTLFITTGEALYQISLAVPGFPN
jgi:gluconolactonase